MIYRRITKRHCWDILSTLIELKSLNLLRFKCIRSKLFVDRYTVLQFLQHTNYLSKTFFLNSRVTFIACNVFRTTPGFWPIPENIYLDLTYKLTLIKNKKFFLEFQSFKVLLPSIRIKVNTDSGQTNKF